MGDYACQIQEGTYGGIPGEKYYKMSKHCVFLSGIFIIEIVVFQFLMDVWKVSLNLTKIFPEFRLKSFKFWIFNEFVSKWRKRMFFDPANMCFCVCCKMDENCQCH